MATTWTVLAAVLTQYLTLPPIAGSESALVEFEAKRREYRYGRLDRSSLSDSPFDQFQRWMQEAIEAQVQDPTAMCLATVAAEGRPSQRTVLLKQFDTSGFVFYTHLESRKAKEIGANNAVSLLFSWLSIDRQISIEGRTHRLSFTSTLKYFGSRPRESQLAAWSSPQSQRIQTRSILESEFRRMQLKFARGDIPLPPFWGGFKVIPDQWEFWQGGEHRLHDRFQYTRSGNGGWVMHRLAP